MDMKWTLAYLMLLIMFSLLFLSVDDLFKEANVKFNGKVHYEEFTRMVTLPPVDY